MNLPYFIARRHFWSTNKPTLLGTLRVFGLFILAGIAAILLYTPFYFLFLHFGIESDLIKISVGLLIGIIVIIPVFIYLLRKGKFINFISVVSMLVVAISTMALIIVLSVFNGLEGTLRNLYGTFEADVVVLPALGKTFQLKPDLSKKINDVPGVLSAVDVIEDNVLVKYKGAQRVVRLKGVGDAFLTQKRFDQAITYGEMQFKKDSVAYAVVGRGIQYDLSINIQNDFHPLVIFYPKDINPGQLNPERLFVQRPIVAGGVFAVEKQFDENYIFVPIEFTQDLFQYKEQRSSIEIQLESHASTHEVKQQLQATLGNDFVVKLNEELHSSLYRILKWEKLFVFLTFAIIIAIGSINIYFSLSMLVISKQKDWAILKALGSPSKLLAQIVLANGALIALGGAFSGLLLGLLISWLQQQYGLVSMGVPGALVDAYPVDIQMWDVIGTTILVIIITLVSSLQPARKAAKALELSHLN